MSPALAILLCLFVIPPFLSSRRAALACLGAQGMVLAWIGHGANPRWDGMEAWLSLADHLLLRGIAIPCALYSALRARPAHGRAVILPPNILAWISAGGAVLLAFNFADLLARTTGSERAPIAVVASAILLGFVVLSMRTGMFGQMVALIFIENAIALFEQTQIAHSQPFGIQAGLLSVTALTILLFRWFLSMPEGTEAESVGGISEGPAI